MGVVVVAVIAAVIVEPVRLVDHGGDHGHDDHAHAEEALGPIDVTLWGAFVLGILLGLVPALGIALATNG